VAVQRFIVEDLGGTLPEQTPMPEQGIAEVRRLEVKRERKHLERVRQPPLFDTPDDM
jgi:hypothetical protein